MIKLQVILWVSLELKKITDENLSHFDPASVAHRKRSYLAHPNRASKYLRLLKNDTLTSLPFLSNRDLQEEIS